MAAFMRGTLFSTIVTSALLLASSAIGGNFDVPFADSFAPGDILLLVSTTEEHPEKGSVESRSLLKVIPPPNEFEPAVFQKIDDSVESFFWSVETSSEKIFLGIGASGGADPCCDEAAGCEIAIASIDPNEEGGQFTALISSPLEIENASCGVYNDLHLVDDERLLAVVSLYPRDDANNVKAIVSLYDTDTGTACSIGGFFADAFPRITSDGANTGWITSNTCADEAPFHCTPALLEFPLDAGCQPGNLLDNAEVASFAAAPRRYLGDPVFEDGIVSLPLADIDAATLTTWWGYDPDSAAGIFLPLPNVVGNWSVEEVMLREVGTGNQELYGFSAGCYDPETLEFVGCSLQSEQLSLATGFQSSVLDYEDLSGEMTSLWILDAAVSQIQVPEPHADLGIASVFLTLAMLSRRRRARSARAARPPGLAA